jgi:hypothetical protein
MIDAIIQEAHDIFVITGEGMTELWFACRDDHNLWRGNIILV